MPLTTRQKSLAGVMLLAGIAFAYDRCTSGKPAQAEAASAELLVQPTPASSLAPSAATAGPSTSTAHLGARLADAARAQHVDPLQAADAFLVPDNWPSARHVAARTSSSATTTPSGPTQAELDRALAAEFVQKHHLDAVMANAAGGYAILNGQSVEVGRSVDRFKLVAVTSTSATFRHGRIQVEIRLANPSNLRLDGTTIENRSVANSAE